MRVKIIFYKHIVPLGSFSAVTYYVEKHSTINKNLEDNVALHSKSRLSLLRVKLLGQDRWL